MRALVIAIGLLVGCHTADKFDDAIVEIDAFKARMCACPDKACADKLQVEWRAYQKALLAKIGEDRPSKAQDKRARDLSDAMRSCRKQLDPASPLAEQPTP